MIEQHDKYSLHEIENLITSLKGIFEKKNRQKNPKQNKQTNNIKQKKKTKRKKKILKLERFDSIKR